MPYLLFIIFLILCYLIHNNLFFQTKLSLSYKVFIGLIFGSILGVILQLSLNYDYNNLTSSIRYISIIGKGYILFLQMIIFPLLLISIISSITKLHDNNSIGKIAIISIATLLITTMFSALIGTIITSILHINASDILNLKSNNFSIDAITQKQDIINNLSFENLVLSIIPANPFLDLTGARKTSIIAVAIFAIITGISANRLKTKNKKLGNVLFISIFSLEGIVYEMVKMIISFTPYAVMSLITTVISNSNLSTLKILLEFIIASYLGLMLILILHIIILIIIRLNPIIFYNKAKNTLIFAFFSRSSSASIPMNIEAQKNKLGFPEAIASFSASFGTSIGQNGCAGLYPAMLATIVAPTVGINTLDPFWILYLVTITTFSSIGITGIGGGATFAALLVLPLMNLPIEIIAILIAIEPIIDMGRTMVNVSGSMIAGAVTSQLLKMTNMKIFNQK